MQEKRASMTAILTAFARAYHATHDEPKIFDDSLAWSLFTEEERKFFGRSLAQALAFFDPELAAICPDEATALAWVIQIQNGPITLSRGRYTEESLATAVEQGVGQYVILGAGLDTFAFRRPEMVSKLQIFEVDLPATQADKRRRLSELGWQIPSQLHFVSLDFTKENVATALSRTSYDPKKKGFFSWLGVTFYLTREVVNTTLRDIAAVAPAGSSIVFDYMDSDAFIPGRAAKRMRKMQEIVRNVGEPLLTGLNPSTLVADLAALGLNLKQDLGPSDIQERYFSGRTDRYRAFEHVHFAWAEVL
jgi:methyltransferase (TIGR00027 family)